VGTYQKESSGCYRQKDGQHMFMYYGPDTYGPASYLSSGGYHRYIRKLTEDNQCKTFPLGGTCWSKQQTYTDHDYCGNFLTDDLTDADWAKYVQSLKTYVLLRDGVSERIHQTFPDIPGITALTMMRCRWCMSM